MSRSLNLLVLLRILIKLYKLYNKKIQVAGKLRGKNPVYIYSLTANVDMQLIDGRIIFC